MLVLGTLKDGSDPSAGLVHDGKNLAYAEEERLVLHVSQRTGLRKLCVGGGVGLNVKMNSKLYSSGLVDEIYIQPICSDSGVPLGSAQAVVLQDTGVRPQPRSDVFSGPSYSDEDVPGCGATMALFARRGCDVRAAVWHGKGGQLTRLCDRKVPHSLGRFYAAMTEHLGVQAHDGEYKVMGLAPYGRTAAGAFVMVRGIVDIPTSRPAVSHVPAGQERLAQPSPQRHRSVGFRRHRPWPCRSGAGLHQLSGR